MRFKENSNVHVAKNSALFTGLVCSARVVHGLRPRLQWARPRLTQSETKRSPWRQLQELHAVAKGIGDAHFPGSPRRRLQARPGIFVLLSQQFLMIGGQPFGSDAHCAAGAAISVMLGDVQMAIVLGDAHIKRQTLLEAMFKIDLKAEKVEVELFGFGFVEAAQNGCCVGKSH